MGRWNTRRRPSLSTQGDPIHIHTHTHARTRTLAPSLDCFIDASTKASHHHRLTCCIYMLKTKTPDDDNDDNDEGKYPYTKGFNTSDGYNIRGRLFTPPQLKRLNSSSVLTRSQPIKSTYFPSIKP